MSRTRFVLVISVGLAAVVGALAGWPTWTVSGSAQRNSYESLRAAQAVGIDQLTPFRVVWFCVPVAAAAVVLLLIARFMRTAAVVAFLTAIVLIGFALAILRTPAASGVGPWISLGAGGVLAAASVGLLSQGRPEG